MRFTGGNLAGSPMCIDRIDLTSLDKLRRSRFDTFLPIHFVDIRFTVKMNSDYYFPFAKLQRNKLRCLHYMILIVAFDTLSVAVSTGLRRVGAEGLNFKTLLPPDLNLPIFCHLSSALVFLDWDRLLTMRSSTKGMPPVRPEVEGSGVRNNL